MRKIAIIVIICISVSCIYAESPSDSLPHYTYLGLGTGINNTLVQDKLNTSLPYSGNCLGVITDFEIARKKELFNISNSFSYGNITPLNSPGGYDNPVSSFYNNLNASFLWQVVNKSRQNFKVYVGPAAGMRLAGRINMAEVGNSGICYEGAFSGAIASKAIKYFSLPRLFNKNKPNRNYSISCYAFLPFMSKVWTTPYLGVPDDLLQEDASMIDINSNYTSSVDKYFNLNLKFTLTYYLHNSNAFEIGYLYDYTSTKPRYNPMKSLNRAFFVKLMYNFD